MVFVVGSWAGMLSCVAVVAAIFGSGLLVGVLLVAACVSTLTVLLARSGRDRASVIYFLLIIDVTACALSWRFGAQLAGIMFAAVVVLPCVLYPARFRGQQLLFVCIGIGSALVAGLLGERPSSELIDGPHVATQLAMHLGVLGWIALVLLEVLRSPRQIGATEGVVAESEEVTRVKSSFMANMSHEIRTPMNSIVGLTDLLRETELSQQQQSLAEKVKANANTLLSLVNNMLDFASVDAGSFRFTLRRVPLHECIADAVDAVALSAAEKGLELTYEIDRGVPHTVRADAPRLQQILVNLLSNAIKFTAQGSVAVAVQASPGPRNMTSIDIEVRDTGIGMSRSQVSRIFTPFAQADSSTTRAYGGTGLGLALCKRLVDAMGGRIEVESAVGKGTQVHVQLLLKQIKGRAPEYLNAVPELKGRTVLVLARASASRRILERYLQLWGIRVVCVDSVEQARRSWAAEHEAVPQAAELVLLDRRTIQRSNYRQLLEDFEISCPKVLMSPLTHEIVQKENAVYRDILSIPIRPTQLFRTITAVLAPTANVSHKPRTLSGAKGLRVLIVEDNDNNIQVLSLALENIGIQADVVKNGQDAVRSAKQTQYDVIFMDLHTPLMDGIEATRRIRARKGTRQPFIAALTASYIQDREKCLQAGMNTYLCKPIQIDDLRRVLSDYLEGTITALTTSGGYTEVSEVSDVKGGVVDRAALVSLGKIVATGTGTLGEFVDRFLPGMKKLIVEVDASIVSQDLKKLHLSAHSLKSNAKTLGSVELATLAEEIELQARNGKFPKSTQLEQAHRRFLTELAVVRKQENW